MVPTFNRAPALRANLGVMLALEGVGEVVVVDDGSTDETVQVCAEFNDGRIKLVRHPRNLGVAAARNSGVDAAAGSWILFGEDDCRFPSNYATVMRGESERLAVDIVGAPVLHIAGTDDEVAAFAARAPRRSRPPSMDESNVFPLRAIRTPFLPAPVLVRRTVFDRIRFYEGYRSNGYREETDFFVQAARSGFQCLLTPETYCYQIDSWSGGQHHSSPLRYEYWVLRNNWRFLRRHGSWLTDEGHINGVVSAQLRFVARRARMVCTGVVRARLARLRGGTPESNRSSDSADPSARRTSV